jgi:short-subunit dehydrogenase
MVAHVYEEWGEIDVLINNAGQIQVGPSEVMRLTDFERAMRVHFWGPLHTTLAVLPRMRARRDGRIVNISSIGGKISVPHLLPYSASKFALTGLSEGLHAELKREGIAVTTVCPGLMRTGSPRNAEFKSKHELEYAWFAWSDSMPGISVAAERAAHRILRACRNGEAEVILTLPARLAVMLHGLFPGLTADMLAVVNRLLPNAGGIGSASAKGHESESLLTRNPALALTRKQERRQNQIA